MKRIFPALIASFGMLAAWLPAAARTETYNVNNDEIYGGYIVKKIWLDQYATPKVSVGDIIYADAAIPAGIEPSAPQNVQLVLGMELKRPLVLVRIPVYSKDANGVGHKVTAFSLTITEDAQQASAPVAAKGTASDVTTSVLSTGTWYRIGITRTGFHKIDAALMTAMGLNPGLVNPANLRVYGNGGRMLPEQNFLPRAVDLEENATVVNDNGNGMFDAGEHVIFYGMGPQGWDADSASDRFSHVKNLYTDTAYYFITFDKGPGLRVQEQAAAPGGNVTVTDFNYYDMHDVDLVNPPGFGKTWYGEQFNPLAGNLTQSFNFDLGAVSTNVRVRVSMGVIGEGGSNCNVLVNGGMVGNLAYPLGTGESTQIQIKNGEWPAAAPAASAFVTLGYTPSGGSVAYLNFVEVNARRPLAMSGDQLSFRDLRSYGAGKVANYVLQGANSATRIWDVTDPQMPVALNGSLAGSTYTFSRDAATLHEFAAMNSQNVYSPVYSGAVANQNLHGAAQVDNIIVTNKAFLQAANDLANYHRTHDNLRVLVVTPEEIYNEFSSGGQDISAIRDFVRMFYKRAGTDVSQMPRYLTLIGAASYDYKDRLPNNSNFVPVFESAESSYDLAAVLTDDFYGFLDDNEYIENNLIYNTLDIGIGRLPARSVEDAGNMVYKIMNYKSPATLGPWRLASTLVADNADGAGDHMEDAEQMGSHITGTTHGLYNHSKIYVDAIPRITTPAGARCPNALAAIADRVYKGTMLINYSGHGNTQVWAEERILTPEDFNKWSNANMLPFMVTATCDYGQYDHPQYVSAGEQLVIKKNGGVISMLTTTAAVYANYNNPLNALFLKTQLAQTSGGEWHTFGEASRIGKNATYATSINPNELANYRKFALLGDPALKPNFPEHFVEIDSIMDVATSEPADTVKALGAYRISGRVHDAGGSTLTGFNGILSVSFFDKPRTISTITTVNKTFKLQDNLVYKGKVSVTDGRFSYTFIAPKDINYYYGTAKISHYAHNGVTDAAGADTSIAVGGFSDNPVISDKPPVVQPYINDSMFQNGGVTGTNTSLFVSLFSETGINVSGNKLGHDLTAVLDDNIEQPYILNDHYETAPNTYQRGYVNFPINGIPNGRHTITVKAWDVNNNSGEGSVDFVVVDGKVMAIENLGNYPNPFSNSTRFVFEHNHPDEDLNVKINIFNTAGALVRGIEQQFTPTGSRTAEITWDGTDDNGSRLASGMYVYRMMITTDKGYRSSAYQKLVIAR
ncbi:type IX secretion system sortase PorU [Nemorincola caseinilytica]